MQGVAMNSNYQVETPLLQQCRTLDQESFPVIPAVFIILGGRFSITKD